MGGDQTSQVNSTVKAKVVASGHYSFYQDPTGFDIGIQEVPKDVASFTSAEDCLIRCDETGNCAGRFSRCQLAARIGHLSSTCHQFFGEQVHRQQCTSKHLNLITLAQVSNGC
jgi:hypothetical protein